MIGNFNYASEIAGFTQQVGDEANVVFSLTALRSLKNLKSLNLEHTQVSDATICPLSALGELSHLSLRTASLTDISLDQLSSLSKLISLGIRDAVLTNTALSTFETPENLKILDLRGCWLLTEDGISSFSKFHPQIEVKHELVQISPLNKVGSSSPSPLRVSSRILKINQRQEPSRMLPMSQSFLGKCAFSKVS